MFNHEIIKICKISPIQAPHAAPKTKRPILSTFAATNPIAADSVSDTTRIPYFTVSEVFADTKSAKRIINMMKRLRSIAEKKRVGLKRRFPK